MEDDDNEDGCAFEETQTPRTLTECFETLAREAKGDLYLVLFLIERPTLLYFVNRIFFFSYYSIESTTIYTHTSLQRDYWKKTD